MQIRNKLELFFVNFQSNQPLLRPVNSQWTGSPSKYPSFIQSVHMSDCLTIETKPIVKVFSWVYDLRNISKRGFGPILLSTTRRRVRGAGLLLHSLSVHFGNCRRTPCCTTTRLHTNTISESSVKCYPVRAAHQRGRVWFVMGKAERHCVACLLSRAADASEMYWSKSVVVVRGEENMILCPPWGSEIRELSHRAEERGQEK